MPTTWPACLPACLLLLQINAALRAIHSENLAQDSGLGPARTGVGAVGGVSDLDGRWRCRITSHQESVSYTIKTDIW